MSVVGIPGLTRGGQVEKYGESGRAFSCTVGAAQAASGGLLLEAMAGDRVVRTAQLNSFVCLGMAMFDAAAGLQVTCAAEGIWMMTATAAVIGSGNKVTCGAAGLVVAAAATPDARFLVAKAIQDIGSGGQGACKLTL